MNHSFNLLFIPTIVLTGLLFTGRFSFPPPDDLIWVSGKFSLDHSVGFEGARNYSTAFGAFQSDQNQKTYHCPDPFRTYLYYDKDIRIENIFENPIQTEFLVEREGIYPNVYRIRHEGFDSGELEEFKSYYLSSTFYLLRFYAPVAIAFFLALFALRKMDLKKVLKSFVLGLAPYLFWLAYTMLF